MLEQAVILPGPLSLIVTSRLADERLWAEALNLGRLRRAREAPRQRGNNAGSGCGAAGFQQHPAVSRAAGKVQSRCRCPGFVSTPERMGALSRAKKNAHGSGREVRRHPLSGTIGFFSAAE